MALPLEPRRRRLIIGLRLATLACVWAALRGWAISQPAQVPRSIVYLADQSDSIDAAQTAWIARRIASLEAQRPPQVVRAVWAFGAHAEPVIDSGRTVLADPSALERALGRAPVAREATNLEAALLSLPAATRAILLSDGRQTRGDVETAVGTLRRLGVELFPVVVPSTEPTGGVSWEALEAPPTVARGQAVPLTLAVHNATTEARRVDVAVRLLTPTSERIEEEGQDVQLLRRRYTLAPGWHVLSLSAPSVEVGSMALDVALTSAQGATEHRAVYVQVEGPPHLLWVMDPPAALPLAAMALKQLGMDVAVATPAELPTEVGGWLDYDGAVLFHLPKSALSEAQVGALERAVRQMGLGVVMVGLGGRLDEELAHDAPLDRLLPVRYEPKGAQESKRRVCVMLAIDRSSSMTGPRIAATKRAAVELVKQLQPEDLIGVLTFDTLPYVVLEVQPAAQAKQTIIDRLVKLKAAGGTDIFPALLASLLRLQESGATVKHLVLLTDGNTNVNIAAYRELLAQFRQDRVTLSTMGIGGMMVNVELLQWMAEATGGTFYQLTDLNELPQLMARDTQQVLGTLPFTEGAYQPVRAPAAEWFSELRAFPPLKGFFTTTAKPGAQVELEMRQPPESAPLMARWSVGLGRVAVFTSDADTRWCAEWLRWDQFHNVWAQLVRWAMRRSELERLFVWVEEHPSAPAQVMIEGALQEPSAELVMADGRTVPLALVPLSPVRWKASLADLASGWYQVMIRARSADQPGGETRPAFAARWIHIGHPTARGDEQPGLLPDEGLLRRAAHSTGGMMDAPDAAFVPPTTWGQRRLPLRGWLLPFALLFLLLEVAIRGRTML